MTGFKSFTEYMMAFYGPEGVYPMGFNEVQVNIATAIYKMRLESRGAEFCEDSVDREAVRDLILEAREVVLPEFSKA